MILKSKETTIAYRCPVCGKIILGMVGIFTLSGDMIKLKCDCGRSELTLTRTNDNRIRLTVPCIICPNPHNYTISADSFFERDVFALACPYSTIDICFIGEKERLDHALHDADEQLIRILNDAGLSEYADFRSGIEEVNGKSEKESDLDFSHVEEIVRFMLAELKEDGCIECGCDDGEGEYDFEFIDDSVRVFCKRCGADETISLASTLAANEFLHTDKLTLEKR